jgi:hypothetical protein
MFGKCLYRVLMSAETYATNSFVAFHGSFSEVVITYTKIQTRDKH